MITKKAVWHSDNSRKEGTIRIVTMHEDSGGARSFRIEERIKDNALGEETWIPFDNERLPSWVTALMSEFVYDRREER